ncbi:MAG TPA: DUF4357 domain-containing protein, partial [Chloroflexota bacterium]|nr:DUF4357 domain-containing protein [Chloroflexota bacterium]
GEVWTKDGVTLPNGTKAQKVYKHKLRAAELQGGLWIVDGKQYDSPSAAAGAITGSMVNGWTFWEVKRPGDATWVLLDNLRSRTVR